MPLLRISLRFVAFLAFPHLLYATTLTTLVNFNSTNGANPNAGLIQGNDGNFYGVTSFGGSSNKGTIFKLTPAGVLTTLVNFNGSNGADPGAGLIQGTDVNFYGTTNQGGAYGNGTGSNG